MNTARSELSAGLALLSESLEINIFVVKNKYLTKYRPELTL